MDRAPHPLDTQPGSLPDIRTNSDGVTFVMTPTGQHGEQLIIRCDARGEVWISIRSTAASN